jgi:DNA-binding XRE family transcriptional regulator
MQTPFSLACEARHTTPTTVAKKVGLSDGNVRRIARGQSMPTWETAVKLAKGLRVSVQSLWENLKK